ncbi:putative siderophore synthetase [Ralstonia insidiosa]|uniref:Siderophore synthetase n=1 Tax=Ralstonia insidiosa TaxID=190721 RepID=A0AAC9BJ51_9RALS|nr:putative siderophore synthetase [Ralstonia insidiosa]
MNVTIHNQLSQHPAQAAAHLTPEVWAQANRLLLRKAIAEYAHELILEPEHLHATTGGFALYQVRSDDGKVCYQFEAQQLALRHWFIQPESIRRLVEGPSNRSTRCNSSSNAVSGLVFVTSCCPSTSTRSAARYSAARSNA